MDGFKRLVIGVGHDPKLVAAVRAFLFYVVPLGTPVLVAWLAGLNDPRYLGIPLALVPVVRAGAEALLDQIRKPDMNQVNPPPIAGSGGPDPAR